MIRATGQAVRGAALNSSVASFVDNVQVACDKLTTTAVECGLECWQNKRLLPFTAETMFDAIFNTVFGRDESSPFNSQLAYHNFQAS